MKSRKERDRRYDQSAKGRARRRRYRRSAKGILAGVKDNARRRGAAC